MGLSEIEGIDNIEIPNDIHIPSELPNKFEIMSPKQSVEILDLEEMQVVHLSEDYYAMAFLGFKKDIMKKFGIDERF